MRALVAGRATRRLLKCDVIMTKDCVIVAINSRLSQFYCTDVVYGKMFRGLLTNIYNAFSVNSGMCFVMIISIDMNYFS